MRGFHRRARDFGHGFDRRLGFVQAQVPGVGPPAPSTQLTALFKLGQIDWSDLGDPERVMAVLQAAGLEPW